MTVAVGVADLLVWALIAGGVALIVGCSVGVWLFRRDPYDALHLTGPATLVAPLPIAAAVIVEEGPTSMAAGKAVLVALLLMVTGPVAGHATARAGRTREHGRWGLRDEERSTAGEL